MVVVLQSKPASGSATGQHQTQRQLVQALRQRMILRHQLNRCRRPDTPADKLSYRAQAIISKLALLERSIARQQVGSPVREIA